MDDQKRRRDRRVRQLGPLWPGRQALSQGPPCSQTLFLLTRTKSVACREPGSPPRSVRSATLFSFIPWTHAHPGLSPKRAQFCERRLRTQQPRPSGHNDARMVEIGANGSILAYHGDGTGRAYEIEPGVATSRALRATRRHRARIWTRIGPIARCAEMHPAASIQSILGCHRASSLPKAEQVWHNSRRSASARLPVEHTPPVSFAPSAQNEEGTRSVQVPRRAGPPKAPSPGPPAMHSEVVKRICTRGPAPATWKVPGGDRRWGRLCDRHGAQSVRRNARGIARKAREFQLRASGRDPGKADVGGRERH